MENVGEAAEQTRAGCRRCRGRCQPSQHTVNSQQVQDALNQGQNLANQVGAMAQQGAQQAGAMAQQGAQQAGAMGQQGADPVRKMHITQSKGSNFVRYASNAQQAGAMAQQGAQQAGAMAQQGAQQARAMGQQVRPVRKMHTTQSKGSNFALNASNTANQAGAMAQQGATSRGNGAARCTTGQGYGTASCDRRAKCIQLRARAATRANASNANERGNGARLAQQGGKSQLAVPTGWRWYQQRYFLRRGPTT